MGVWGGFCCSAPHRGRGHPGREEGHTQEHTHTQTQESTRECCTYPLPTYQVLPLKQCPKLEGAGNRRKPQIFAENRRKSSITFSSALVVAVWSLWPELSVMGQRNKGGWKTQGRGKHTIKPLPKNGSGPPPMTRSPPLPLFTPCHSP